MHWKTALSAFVLIVVTTTHARAGDPPIARTDDAALEKGRGDRAMDALRFDEALEAYTHAYELGHDPAVLYNRGRLHQARGDYPRALDDLEMFERDAPPALRAKVPKLAELLGDVRAHVATLTLKCNVPGARVMVRGNVVGTTPLDALRLNAGPAKVEVSAPDHAPYASDATFLPGSTTVLEIVLISKDVLGTLSVSASGPPATILVDGENVGVAPLEVLRPPGTHRVVVKRDAADDVETSAVLVAGTRNAIHFDAPPKRSLTSRWWFWGGVGAVVVGVAVTVFVVARQEKSPADGENFSPTRVSGPLRIAW